MKAFCLVRNGEPATISARDVARPEAVRNQLLVKVHAAGITTSELGWYPNLHTKQGEPRDFAIPAHEFSGVVEVTGPEVSEYKPGDAVYGMNDWFEEGALAEYCLAIPSSVVPKPPTISHVEAASIPIGALTARQGLFERANLQTRERVLIQGAAGAVGLFAVQMARQRGARIFSTASPMNFEFVRSLGSDEVVDYRSDYFSTQAGSFDVVFDVVGESVLEHSWSLLKPGGRMVTIASASEGQTDDRTKQAFFIVEPNHSQLMQISKTIETARLRTAVKAVLPLEKAADAYRPDLRENSGPGKVVVKVID